MQAITFQIVFVFITCTIIYHTFQDGNTLMTLYVEHSLLVYNKTYAINYMHCLLIKKNSSLHLEKKNLSKFLFSLFLSLNFFDVCTSRNSTCNFTNSATFKNRVCPQTNFHFSLISFLTFHTLYVITLLLFFFLSLHYFPLVLYHSNILASHLNFSYHYFQNFCDCSISSL